MASDQTKIIAGVILLVLSSIVLIVSGLELSMPLVLAAIATTGLAIGSLLVGTSGEGRSV